MKGERKRAAAWKERGDAARMNKLIISDEFLRTNSFSRKKHQNVEIKRLGGVYDFLAS